MVNFEINVTFDIVGYLQTIIWFWEYPWVLTSSLTFFDQTRLHTCFIVTIKVHVLFVKCLNYPLTMTKIQIQLPGYRYPCNWGENWWLCSKILYICLQCLHQKPRAHEDVETMQLLSLPPYAHSISKPVVSNVGSKQKATKKKKIKISSCSHKC